MNCEKFSYLLDEYLQGSLSNQQIRDIEKHLSGCDDCKLLLQIRRDCRQLDKSFEVPENFSSSWRQTIREQEESKVSEFHPKNRINFNRPALKRWFAVAASLVFVIGGTWMVGQNISDKRANTQESVTDGYNGGFGDLGGNVQAPFPVQKMDTSARAAPEAYMAQDEMAASPESFSPQKIIRTISLNLVTRAFDEDLVKLNEALINVGGYIEYSNISGDRGSKRYAGMTLRIPKNQLDDYLKEVKGFGRVTSITESQEDVSDQYSDTKTRLLTQTTKMSRLQELLSKANLVEDILNIEREIADTQYQVDSLTGSLRGIDSKVDYSTVQLSLQEEIATTEPTELSLSQRIKLAVSDAWQATNEFLKNLLVLLVVVLPYILFMIVLIVIIKKIFWRKKK